MVYQKSSNIRYSPPNPQENAKKTKNSKEKNWEMSQSMAKQ